MEEGNNFTIVKGRETVKAVKGSLATSILLLSKSNSNTTINPFNPDELQELVALIGVVIKLNRDGTFPLIFRRDLFLSFENSHQLYALLDELPLVQDLFPKGQLLFILSETGARIGFSVVIGHGTLPKRKGKVAAVTVRDRNSKMSKQEKKEARQRAMDAMKVKNVPFDEDQDVETGAPEDLETIMRPPENKPSPRLSKEQKNASRKKAAKDMGFGGELMANKEEIEPVEDVLEAMGGRLEPPQVDFVVETEETYVSELHSPLLRPNLVRYTEDQVELAHPIGARDYCCPCFSYNGQKDQEATINEAVKQVVEEEAIPVEQKPLQPTGIRLHARRESMVAKRRASSVHFLQSTKLIGHSQAHDSKTDDEMPALEGADNKGRQSSASEYSELTGVETETSDITYQTIAESNERDD